ncbi:MAG TPA: 4Fe-4S binding protein [Nonomuraea sp.]|nr:4Fe-4S binding protein [Nonomuraea sp.]
MLCARECPDWCIYIDSHKETVPAPEGGRPRQRNVLDRFAIDFSLCMYCGICIEVCPFDALFWSPEFEYAEGDIRNLIHEKEKLATWSWTVPPPPIHDPGAEPPKERAAKPRRPASDRPSRGPADRPAPRPASGPPERTGPSERSSAGGTPDSPPSGTPEAPAAGTPAKPPQEPPATRSARPSEPGPAPHTEAAGGPTARREEPGSAPEPATGPEPETGAPGRQASSTGEPFSQELSTASGERRTRPAPDEQTSGPSPRRRRMADPRSIRPPGRLGPDETRESEEES